VALSELAGLSKKKKFVGALVQKDPSKIADNANKGLLVNQTTTTVS